MRSAAENPKYVIGNGVRLLPRTTAVVITPLWAQNGFDKSPLFVV